MKTDRVGQAPEADRILISGLEFVGRHGVYEEERQEGRLFQVDLEVGLPPGHQAHRTDDLEDAVDYRSLCATIMEVGRGTSVHLIERLAQLMCEGLLAKHQLVWVELTLRKKVVPPLAGEPRWVAVRLRRSAREGQA